MISGQSRAADFLSGDICSSDCGNTLCSAFAVLTGWASSPWTVSSNTGQVTRLYSSISVMRSGKLARQAPLSTEQKTSGVEFAFSHPAALPVSHGQYKSDVTALQGIHLQFRYNDEKRIALTFEFGLAGTSLLPCSWRSNHNDGLDSLRNFHGSIQGGCYTHKETNTEQ